MTGNIWNRSGGYWDLYSDDGAERDDGDRSVAGSNDAASRKKLLNGFPDAAEQVLCQAGPTKNCVTHCQRLVWLAQEDGDDALKSSACANLASALRQVGELAAARAWQQHALRHGLQPERPPEELAHQLSGRACDALLAGDLTLAEQLFVRALWLEQLAGDTEGEADDWGNLALVYFASERWDWVVVCLTKALQLHRSLGNCRCLGLDLYHLGRLALRLGKLREATRWLQLAASFLRVCGAVDALLEVEAALDEAAMRAQTQRRQPPN